MAGQVDIPAAKAFPVALDCAFFLDSKRLDPPFKVAFDVLWLTCAKSVVGESVVVDLGLIKFQVVSKDATVSRT